MLDGLRRAGLNLARGVIHQFSDSPKLQTVDFRGFQNELITAAENFAHAFGHYAVPVPPDEQTKAAEVIMAFLNGDRSHPVIIAHIDRRYRPTKGENGQVGHYHFQGATGMFRQAGFAHNAGPNKKPHAVIRRGHQCQRRRRRPHHQGRLDHRGERGRSSDHRHADEDLYRGCPSGRRRIAFDMNAVSLGQAISIIGGSPILKNALGHTCDKLKIPRHIDVGNVPGMSSILSGIVSGGGTASLLQSPLGSALTPLTTALSSAVTSLASQGSTGGGSSGTSGSSTGTADTGTSDDGSGTTGVDYTPLVNALNNLSTSATNLSALADNLVGVASNAALPTQFDAIGHMNLAQSLGTALPATLSLATVLAPTGSASLLTSALTSVQPIITETLAGTMAVSDAVTATETIQAGLDAVTNASTGAVTSLQAMAPALAAGQATIALLVAGSPEMVAALNTAIRPDMQATVQAIVTAHEAQLAVAASSQAAAAAAAESVAAAIAADLAQAASSS